MLLALVKTKAKSAMRSFEIQEAEGLLNDISKSEIL
jgi:hypothetical protein